MLREDWKAMFLKLIDETVERWSAIFDVNRHILGQQLAELNARGRIHG
jgi:hypothetical protein